MLSSVACFFVLSLPVMSLYSESTNAQQSTYTYCKYFIFSTSYPELYEELFLTSVY